MNRFRHIYNLGDYWYKKFRKKYKDYYKFIFDREKQIFYIYDNNGEHVITYLPDDETVFTDLPVSKIYEDAMGGVGAPMATLTNTPGMGNVTPAGVGTIGSGDNFGSSIGNMTYTQNGKAKKKKKPMKKRAKKVNEEEIQSVVAKFFYTSKDGKDIYQFDIYPILKASGGRELFRKVITHLLLDPDKFMGVTWSNYDKTISVDTEDNNYVPITFAEDKIDEISNVLGVEIKLDKSKVLDEENINPYDKMGMAMAKKMKVKPPFKKKKDSNNQNSMTQRKFEHQIITFDEFKKQLNENILNERADNIHLDYSNTYWEVISPFNVYILTGFVPGNAYYGSANIRKHTFKVIELQTGDQIHSLVGGNFIVTKDKKVLKSPHIKEPEYKPLERQSDYNKFPLEKMENITNHPEKINKPKSYV